MLEGLTKRTDPPFYRDDIKMITFLRDVSMSVGIFEEAALSFLERRIQKRPLLMEHIIAFIALVRALIKDIIME